jgi:hypothetical protein
MFFVKSGLNIPVQFRICAVEASCHLGCGVSFGGLFLAFRRNVVSSSLPGDTLSHPTWLEAAATPQ